MSRIKIPTLVLFLVLLANIGVQCQAKSFVNSLSSLLSSRNEMVKAMESIKDNVNTFDNLKKYIQTLDDLERYGQEVKRTKMSVFREEVPKLKDAISSMSSATKLFDSEGLNLEQNSIKSFWGKLEMVLTSFHTHKFTSFNGICPSRFNLTEISTTDVCKSSLSCAQESHPYQKYIVQGSINIALGFAYYSTEPDLKDACTKGKKCNTEKALPLMTGILWHEVEYMIMKKLCPPSCWPGGCNIKSLGDVLQEVKLVQAYASMHQAYFSPSWNDFFSDYQSNGGFQTFAKASSVFENYRKQFKMAQLACNTLKYHQACPYGDLLETYDLVKGNAKKNNQQCPVKDLRLYSQMDNQKMIELQRDAMHHLETLSTIKALDENLKASVSGISEYLQGVAKFDEGIANADVAFIKGQLAKYENKSSEVEKEMSKKLSKGMKLMIGVLTMNLVDKVTQLALLVAEQANPMKTLLTGSDLVGMNEKAGEVADAASQIVKGSTLIKSLSELKDDSLKLYNAFNENKKQLSSLENLVNKIINNQLSNIDEDAKKYIEEYNNYSPKVSRADIAKNNALWSAFKDATCALLEGETGIGGSIPKAIAGGELLCEKLEGVMAQFFTLREDIFDFQFRLVDAVTNVIRANMKQRLAGKIKGKGDVLSGGELISASILIQFKLSTVASLYCDVLEYKNQGNSITACRKDSYGFFSKDNLDTLIAYRGNSPYTQVETEAFIPTRASFPGDTGYIDLAALGRGEEAILRIPNNKTWLEQYGMVLPETQYIPFVEDLKLFLPHTATDDVLTTIQLKVSSIAGCSFLDKPVRYMLPDSHRSFLNVYQGGYRFCANEIENPYSLCGNLPNICDLSKNVASYSILPTVLSTWKIRLSIYQGSKKLTWNAPAPATNLLIRAKVKIRIPKEAANQGLGGPPAFTPSADHCCEGNKYRKSPYISKCLPCPESSQSRERGLYCEIK